MKLKHLNRSYFDGESGENNGGNTPPPKTFTQDQVEGIVVERVKKMKQELQTTLSRMQELETSNNLTTEERESLRQQVEQLQNTVFTKEELAKKQQKLLEERHANEVKQLKENEVRWKGLFESSTIERALTDAAVSAEAVVPSQIVEMLARNTRLVEEAGEDGKSKGTFVPMVKIKALDKDSKPIILDLPVSDAVKQMKETPTLYGNLFKHGATGGVGGTTIPGEQSTGPLRLEQLKDIEQYKKNRQRVLA